MIGIVIVAHAPLATALLGCAEHVFGAVPDVTPLDVPSRADATEWAGTIQQAIVRADQGNGVLVLTDLFGATPSNLAIRASGATPALGTRSVVVAGVNAPMLMRAITYRHMALDEVVQRALSGGTQGVLKVGTTAPQNQLLKKNDDGLARYQHQQ